MADVTLTAELRANIDNLEKNIGTAVKTVVSGSQQIDIAAGKASKALKGVNPASNQAAFALTNLGRVAQDAPFGFIAIQNNIGPLVDSLGYLAKQSKETGTSIGKNLLGALTGPAGIGLAIGLATAAITLFIQHQQKTAAALKNVKKSADDYVSTLDSVRQAQLKGAQDGAQEITRLNILYNATQNHTLSLSSRNAAYDELASKYPKFFTNADREKTLLGTNALAYDNLSKAILATARAKAFEAKIGELSNKDFENGEKLVDLIRARTKARQELTLEELKASQTRGSAAGLVAGDLSAISRTNQARKTYNDIETAINNKLQEQAGIRKTISDLTTLATGAESEAGFKTSSALDDKNEKLKEQKTFLQQLEDQLRWLQSAEAKWIEQGNKQDFFHQTERERAINSLIAKIAELKAATDGIDTPTVRGTNAVGSQQLGAVGGATTAGLDSPEAMKDAIKTLSAYIQLKHDSIDASKDKAAADKKEIENLKTVEGLIGGGLMDAFQSALQGTQSFVTSMGQFFTQLISKLVATALAAAALAAILQFTGVGALLGISSSASSFGNVFKGLSGLNFLADGGITTKPTIAMIGEGREPEAVIPLSKLDNMLGNNQQQGSAKWVTRTILRGDKLHILEKRADKSIKRRS